MESPDSFALEQTRLWSTIRSERTATVPFPRSPVRPRDLYSRQLQRSLAHIQTRTPSSFSHTPPFATISPAEQQQGHPAQQPLLSQFSSPELRSQPQSASPSLLKGLECSLTKRLMRDPVICQDGFSYERAAITEWLKSGWLSPVTGEALPSALLIPNRALADIIQALPADRNTTADMWSPGVCSPDWNPCRLSRSPSPARNMLPGADPLSDQTRQLVRGMMTRQPSHLAL
eukprot:TRINITY_DN11042_c0_g1_i1.p1 TRINITY_DN11042_c0_g1~~TRINITY_DN11042_c0_g1_i1.p1  ORF type:complete len:231 (+),score=7.83 TRINITY_DN11042_c0_g1_i1:115-807(+)